MCTGHPAVVVPCIPAKSLCNGGATLLGLGTSASTDTLAVGDATAVLHKGCCCTTHVWPSVVASTEVAYTGGRSLSFSDMLVKITHRSSLSHLCSLIVAVISVIEQRQLALPHDMHLVDALQDPRYMDRVTQVVQQAYGHAVMNECPFAAITTGKVTHFLRRSLTDPTDSTVWVSPPVSFEGEAVPPLAAWLHLLNLAQSHALQPDGTKRPGWPRERVPVPTQNGYKLVLGGRAVKVGK
eukprot:GHUV01040828.1.p1 GENE.GHUV01040828.1~~GHUV01040828.1.p1  ORF type:complete len:239 (+),score=49.18 GHUV01040828.1:1107-1823(+)